MSWMAGVLGTAIAMLGLAVPGEEGKTLTLISLCVISASFIGMGIELAIKESRK